ncbi:MAG: hypothetical protein N2449_09680 [Bacteroidales bacterium]|nr:hypothetical protein [Bacteroidales bacterium]
MTENKEKSVTSSVLSIAALVIAIVSFAFSLIPFLGVLAIVSGSLALILSVIAYFTAAPKQSKTLILAVFIVSIFSIIFSYWQYQNIKALSDVLSGKAEKTIQQTPDDLEEIQQLESLDSLNSNYNEMKSRLDSM